MESNDSTPIILFIGLTQNGKSSVIKSILEYAGDDEQAEKVEQGYNSLSTTKHVTAYSTVVPFKDYYLRYKDGRGRIPHPDGEEEEDEVKLEEVDQKNGMRVIFIDSPGLSDSRTPAPRNTTNDEPPRKIEDEKHKLEVLCALSAVSRLNSVCFVVKRAQPFGWEFQRHLADYVTIFRLSSILEHVNFHVLHTQIDIPYRSKALNDESSGDDEEGIDECDERKLWSTNRAETFDRVVGVKATHHWMDNRPAMENPIAQYFSKRAISQLIQDLRNDSSIACPNLRYPKGEFHKLQDKDLQRSYDSLIYRLRCEKCRLNTELAGLRRDIRPKISRRNGLKSEIERIYSKIQPLDTTELVEVGKDKRYKPAKWDNWEPTLCFRIEASAKIRKIVLDPESPTNARWVVISSKDDHYHANYQADLFSDAKASIFLQGYKKDLYHSEITKYKTQKDGLLEIMEKVTLQIKAIEVDIGKTEASIDEIDCKIAVLEQDKSKVEGESFLLNSFRETAELFLSGGLYSICQGYSLETIVHKSHLPRHFLDKSEVNSELWALNRKESRMIVGAKEALDDLEKNLEREFNMLCTRTRTHRTASRPTIDENVPITPQSSANFRETEASMLSLVNRAAMNKLEETCSRSNSAFKEEFGQFDSNFRSSELSTMEKVEMLENMVAKSTRAVQKAKMTLRKHLANKRAWSLTMGYFKAEEIPIGVFTILFNAIQKKKNPYMALYEDIVIFVAQDLAAEVENLNVLGV